MTPELIELTNDVSFTILDETDKGTRVLYREQQGYKTKVTHDVVMLVG